ncbi:MAG: alpha/beta hydrolase [Alphaproteobacteria bacterium]|nr:alpha/beta hydrolase [Alphaproteobacteria bacterium]
MKKANLNNKPTLIFIHGMRGNHRGLIYIARHLRDRYNVIVTDIPGSGGRPELANKTNEGYADWLHQFIEDKHFKQKPIIIGHSMGSMITSNFIRKYPNDIDNRVIYLAPVFRTRKNKKKSIRRYKIIRFCLGLLPSKWAYKFESSKLLSYAISHYLTVDKTQQKKIDEIHYRYSGRFASHKSFISDAKIAMCETTWLTDKKNTLVIFGKGDKLTPYKYAAERCKKYNVKFTLLDGVGHFLNYERPAEVAEIINDFIESNN